MKLFHKGENTHQFVLALKEKPSAHSFWKNVKRDVRYWGQNWFLILTSWISRKGGVNGSIISWFGVILPALFLGFRFYRREENSVRKNFVLVSASLVFGIFSLLYSDCLSNPTKIFSSASRAAVCFRRLSRCIFLGEEKYILEGLCCRGARRDIFRKSGWDIFLV